MLSVVLRSSTVACHSYVTLSCTGWMFLNESSISLEWPFTNVFKAGHRSTSWTAAPASDVASRQHLGSASHYQLIVPWHHHSKFGRWTFSFVGPMTCNSLPDSLRDAALSGDKFRAALKTLFSSIGTCSALEASCIIALYKCTITYLYHILPSP